MPKLQGLFFDYVWSFIIFSLFLRHKNNKIIVMITQKERLVLAELMKYGYDKIS